MFAIPLAWLQLKREKVRLLVALAGIGFAVILMFLQLGFQDALFESAVTFHKNLKGDVFLVSSQSTSLISLKSFDDRRLYAALGTPGVEKVSPVKLGFGIWKNPFWEGPPKSQTRSIMVVGIDPDDDVMSLEGLEAENRNLLRLEDRVLFDRKSRDEFGPIAAKFDEFAAKDEAIEAEVEGRRLTIANVFELGASFGADGNMVVSNTTFHRLFNRKVNKIDMGVIQLKPDADVVATLDILKQTLPGEFRVDPELKPAQAKEDFFLGDIRVMSRDAFIAAERKYWAEGTAIGFIFTLGTAIGFIVGIVIVYQILYTDVADHLAEYATLKAMGYYNRYLLKVVFQEAFILAVMGFIPGYFLSTGMYKLTRGATALPIGMTQSRSTLVFCLTVIMCLVSGAIAVRKVADADPADIF
ncbi:FtsX-like permease family protein [filamentous cyanobacterium LEGE 11480]|uniref:FtsX-like permease family protein n=1 Tax=Romeriopsis navalis LEGE 11480 TaxID=2777977 RepID=A0A928VNS5_9CYAN|nr:FtsX-like permease family protein [Romeriopsis navalis]MBE9029890.1 FtsX-like permease family protein [Romeriopsis navalis LEGE 11480]